MHKVAVIGAGNGGQAMAGFLGLCGHEVRLYDRTSTVLEPIRRRKGVDLIDAINGFGPIEIASNSISKVIEGADLIMVTTTANAHASIMTQLAPFLEDSQVVVLNPGKTLGALEARRVLNTLLPNKTIYVGEAQSLVYACRIEAPAIVRIIGIKDRVLLSAMPSSDTETILNRVKPLYPCFQPVDSILVTGLENFGAILHPVIVLLNAAAIERGNNFYFYHDITPRICSFLYRVDEERLMIGKAFGLHLHSLEQWVSFAYNGIDGRDLLSRIKNNAAYYRILAPKTLRSRMLTEDIPTGIVPMTELGRLAGLKLPLMNAILDFSSCLIGEDFMSSGRTMESLGLSGMSVDEVARLLR